MILERCEPSIFEVSPSICATSLLEYLFQEVQVKKLRSRQRAVPKKQTSQQNFWQIHKTFVVILSLSCVQLFANPWSEALQASLPFTISWSLLKLMSIESMMPPNHLVICHPLLLCPQSFPTSGSFSVSQFFTSGGHSIGASAPVLPVNIQGLFPLEVNGLISSCSKITVGNKIDRKILN